MIKLTGKLDDLGLDKEIESVFKQAVKETFAKTAVKVQNYAMANLDKGYDKWEKGFSVDEVGDGTFILTVQGKVAKAIEEGWKSGEISDMLLNGSRYKYNKSQGKDYVDVPLEASNSQVKKFLDADGLMKQFQQKKVTFSAPGRNPPIKEDNRFLRRVKEVIESKKTKDSDSKFLVIKRVTKDSVWPKNPKPGVNALEHGSAEIGKDFEEILERLL